MPQAPPGNHQPVIADESARVRRDSSDSDLDILVDPSPGKALLDLGAI